MDVCAREPAVSGRSAALAALLTEAPQCVPFNQRVLIFRSLVTADKERCAVHIFTTLQACQDLLDQSVHSTAFRSAASGLERKLCLLSS